MARLDMYRLAKKIKTAGEVLESFCLKVARKRWTSKKVSYDLAACQVSRDIKPARPQCR
jgi:hypothetical protein